VQIQKNSVVTLQYKLFNKEGALVEQTSAPISYLHGGYDGIFPLVEEALHGQEAGHQCRVNLDAENAFGEYEADLVRTEPRNAFPKDVKVGMQFEGAVEGSDDYALYTVTEVADNTVMVDGNHPLAGQSLVFECTVVEVRGATREELQHGHVHGPHGHHH
jgi:FKBP-type peptidyl-prolyl cis-trans isomerase SlyD